MAQLFVAIMQGESVVVRSIDPNHCFATWDRVLIQMWRGEATLRAAEALLKVAQSFIAERTGEPLNCLSIVGSQSPPPNGKVRAILADCYRALEPKVIQQIWVAEGSHSRAALVRGVGLTVSTSAPSPLPLRFALSMDEAAQLLAPHLSTPTNGAERLKAAVDWVRSRLEALPSGLEGA
jgi:hypothetical protein